MSNRKKERLGDEYMDRFTGDRYLAKYRFPHYDKELSQDRMLDTLIVRREFKEEGFYKNRQDLKWVG